ncbi:MAG: hypothetical protein ABSD10_04100 [Candidatus Saccharimonadales bacterium]|jgi:hypothetical protein
MKYEFFRHEPEPDYEVSGFREYFVDDFGIVDSSAEDRVIYVFRRSATDAARNLGAVSCADPIERARQVVIAARITEPEQQRSIL